jgi:hypothetical protein
MVAHGSHGIREKEQDQAPDHGVELPPGIEGEDVALREPDVGEAGIGAPRLRDLERLRRLLDAEDGTFRADQRSDELGDVSDTAAEVEDLHSRPDPCRFEQHAGRLLDRGGLVVEPRDLVGVTP